MNIVTQSVNSAVIKIERNLRGIIKQLTHTHCRVKIRPTPTGLSSNAPRIDMNIIGW